MSVQISLTGSTLGWELATGSWGMPIPLPFDSFSLSELTGERVTLALAPAELESTTSTSSSSRVVLAESAAAVDSPFTALPFPFAEEASFFSKLQSWPPAATSAIFMSANDLRFSMSERKEWNFRTLKGDVTSNR